MAMSRQSLPPVNKYTGLYIDDHAAHLANCASAGDDTLTLMSTELIPRLEGGIRAVLDEAANL